MLSQGNGAIGEIGCEVEEHGCYSGRDEVGVVWAGHHTVECLPQISSTVPSIKPTVRHPASLEGERECVCVCVCVSLREKPDRSICLQASC